jgi:hypothetical protein
MANVKARMVRVATGGAVIHPVYISDSPYKANRAGMKTDLTAHGYVLPPHHHALSIWLCDPPCTVIRKALTRSLTAIAQRVQVLPRYSKSKDADKEEQRAQVHPSIQ